MKKEELKVTALGEIYMMTFEIKILIIIVALLSIINLIYILTQML